MKSKTIGSICDIGYDDYTKHGGGSHHPWLRSVVPLEHGMGQANIWINITSTVYEWQLVTRCLILGAGFLGQPIRWRHCRGRNCSTRATAKLGTAGHIVVAFILAKFTVNSQETAVKACITVIVLLCWWNVMCSYNQCVAGNTLLYYSRALLALTAYTVSRL